MSLSREIRRLTSLNALLAAALSLAMAGCASQPGEPDQPAGGTDVAMQDNPDGSADAKTTVEKPEDAGPEASAPKAQSLFERAGGKATIDAVASDFIDLLAQAPLVKASPSLAAMLSKDQSHHKQMMSDYLCRVSGGPCTYGGKKLRDAHLGMKITSAQWTAMGTAFIKALRKNNVPKSERAELATLVAANKPLIVN